MKYSCSQTLGTLWLHLETWARGGGGAKFDKLIDLPDLCINHKLCTKNVSEGTGETNHRTVAA